MKIQYCSDLHLEFQQNSDYLKKNRLKSEGDILVLAGDIVPFAVMHKFGTFFNFLSNSFQHTYWLPGNHEYYNFDIAAKRGTIHERIRSNVSLVNNLTVRHGDIRLIFSTLWSKIGAGNEWFIERSMSDFQAIRSNGFRFSSAVFNGLHDESIQFIMNETTQLHAGKTIVATHHVPTLMNYPAKFKGDFLNEAFAVELFPFIYDSAIDYWVYGHHHCNTNNFAIGKTTMVTNQLGYVQAGEHALFDPGKMIVVESD